MLETGDDLGTRFGVLVRERRRALSMSQDDLAAEIRFTQAAISSWEAGDSVPTLRALLALVRSLDITIADLIALQEAAA